jgi:hypothetical protein
MPLVQPAGLSLLSVSVNLVIPEQIAMGLPMNDLHTPSVASGPTSGQRAADGLNNDKLSLIDLISEKQRVESELSALSSVLDSVCI